MIDLHCHLDLYPEPVRVAKECIDRGMYVLSMTNAPSAWTGTAGLEDGSGRIRTAVGLHPQLAQERRGELQLLRELLPGTNYVGEIGIDGSPNMRQHIDTQRNIFAAILDACEDAGGKVLSVHSRHAGSEVIDLLEMHRDAGPVVLHWFSGSRSELSRAVTMGCWFSVGPAMTMSAKGRALVAEMPLDRVITESDGPFAQIGGRPAMPWDVCHAERALAEIWGVSQVEASTRVFVNFKTLLLNQQRK